MSAESMSNEVELVRRWNRAIESRDPSAFAMLSADCIYRPIDSFADRQERHGPDEFRSFMQDWWESWEEGGSWRLDTIRVYGEAVVALCRFHGRARASGIETAGGVFQVFRFRDGRIRQIEDFTDKRHAICAAERPE
jgi:ketosteroid isomerase-like protein